jgi:hypothetical protein
MAGSPESRIEPHPQSTPRTTQYRAVNFAWLSIAPFFLPPGAGISSILKCWAKRKAYHSGLFVLVDISATMP